MKSRLYYAVLCYVSAVLLLFLGIPLTSKISYPKAVVVCTVKDIAQGEQITKNHVTEKEIGTWNLSQDMLYSIDDVLGRYAAVDLVSEDILLSTKISQLPLDGDVPKDILPEDHEVALLELKMIEGSEYPMPEMGDVIKLNRYHKKLTDIPELQFIRVLSVLPQEDKESISVTVAVNTEQKEYINRHKEDTFYGSVIVRSNEELAEKLLLEQRLYFEEG